MFGLAIGSCITVGGYAIGGVSGGSLNPAVSFGIDTTNAIFEHEAWRNCLYWSAFELLGAAVAAAAFYITRQTEYGKDYQSMA
jgi:glycerol uptake facilitator-like aquaporin